MWALATRSRPQQCQRFIQAWQATHATSSVYVRLDLCDPYLPDLQQINWPKEFEIVVGARSRIGPTMNEMFHTYPNESWYGILADDVVPATHRWDQQLIDCAGSTNISYPNDQHDRDWPTHPCVGGDLVRNVGWFGLPVVQHYFTDTFWKWVGDAMGNLHRLDTVVVEHLHYSNNKSKLDETYLGSQSQWRSDKLNWRNWQRDHGQNLLERLKC